MLGNGSDEIRFTVIGLPQGKGRPRFTKTGRTYTPDKTVAFERSVRQAWKLSTCPAKTLAGALKAEIDAYFAVPKSTSRKKAAMMYGKPQVFKPDADNIGKAVLDALNGYAYHDDSCVACLVVRKRYTDGVPRTEVRIRGIDDAED